VIDGNYVPTDAEFAQAYRACSVVTFGDGSGRWASTLAVAHAACCVYGRARRWLEVNAARHPSGADFWQVSR
jgi:hypothetical protein